MIQKTLVRVLGALACLSAVGAGWEAEAAMRRYSRCCPATCCCDPCHQPACCPTVVDCCTPRSYTVVRETVIAPAPCCASSASTRESRVATAPAAPAVTPASTRR